MKRLLMRLTCRAMSEDDIDMASMWADGSRLAFCILHRPPTGSTAKVADVASGESGLSSRKRKRHHVNARAVADLWDSKES